MQVRRTALFALLVFAMLLLARAATLAQSGDRRAAALGKLDARLKMEVSVEPTFDALSSEKSGDRLVPVFVRGDVAVAAAAIERAGGMVGSRLDGILTADIPFSKIMSIAGEPSVLRIEAAARIVAHDDSLRFAIRSDLANAGMPPLVGGYTGKGVIVGVIDVGIDIDHREFRDRFDASRSRFLSIWSQTISGGPRPEGFGYGSEWKADVIERQIARGEGSIPVDTLASDPHGTHVTGIAAGLSGVAPDADIIVVQVAAYLSANPPFATRIIDGARYIFEQATRLGKPCVINVSMGDDEHPHDGSDLMSRALDQLVAASDGRVICAAAGNSGRYHHHWGGFPLERDSLWTYLLGSGWSLRIPDSALSTFEFSVIADTGSSIAMKYAGQIPWRTVGAIRSAPGIVADTLYDRDRKILQIVRSSAAPLADGHTELYIGFAVNGQQHRHRLNVRGSGRIHMWSDDLMGLDYINQLDWEINNRFRAPDSLYDISRPAIARNTIAVGSAVNRASYTDTAGTVRRADPPTIPGALSFFSSRGPSADGRVKPDIVAPGEFVMSARSAHALVNGIKIWGEDTSKLVMSGTSMASPAAAGAVALYLQRRPHATFEEVRAALIAAARRDAFTASAGPLPNAHWGNGKLDIFAALAGITSGTPVPEAPLILFLR